MKLKPEFNAYEVSFIIEQRGEYMDWVKDVILSGLRNDEGLYSLVIREIPEEELITH
jgi:hypothetical protein